MPMTLEKAIQILSDSAHLGMTTFNQDFKDAQKLGIEALKRCRLARKETSFVGPALLPGETRGVNNGRS